MIEAYAFEKYESLSNTGRLVLPQQQLVEFRSLYTGYVIAREQQMSIMSDSADIIDRRFALQLEEMKGLVLVRNQIGEPVGYIALGTVGYLYTMYVREEDRRRGLGEQLITQAMEIAVKQGETYVEADALGVGVPNILRRLGFRHIHKAYYRKRLVSE